MRLPGGYEWERVESSHVLALCFEPTGFITLKTGHRPPLFKTEYGYLYVAFKNGKVYQYTGISRADYELILYAGSVGSALYNLVTIVQEGTVVGEFNPRVGGGGEHGAD